MKGDRVECYGGSIGGGGPRREVGHSPPSVAEVKNKWSCTSIPFVFMVCTPSHYS